MGHNLESAKFETKGSKVVIEDNVFVFSNTLIMPGVIIGKGSIVLAGSVVTKSCPANSLIGGNPAKVIKTLQREIDYKQNYFYWFAL